MSVINVNENQAVWNKEIVKEERVEGRVANRTYFDFFKAGGGFWTRTGLITAFVAGQALLLGFDFTLSLWAGYEREQQQEIFYPILVLIMGFLVVIVSYLRTVYLYIVVLNASGNIFRKMLSAVSRAPMEFFEVNPHGRVLNRFTKDQALVDETLPGKLHDTVIGILIMACVLLVIAISNPYIIITFPFLLTLFIWIRKMYIFTSRQIKRIEATTRSPIYVLYCH